MNRSDLSDRPLARALEAPVSRSQSGGPVDAEDRIVTDVLCVNCGAKIRGQLITDNCYECGHPNTDSVYGDLLIHTEDRQVVTKLHESASIVIWSAAFTGVLGLIIMLAPILSATSAVAVIDAAFKGVKFAVMIFPLVAFVGIMLLTRHGTIEYYEQKYANVGFLIRATVYLVLALAVIALLSRFAGPVLKVLAFLVWTLLPPFLFFRGLAGLMRRIPNLSLAAYCYFVAAGGILLGVAGVGVFYMEPLAEKSQEWEGPTVALKAVIVIGAIGWSIGAYALLVAVRKTLKSIGA